MASTSAPTTPELRIVFLGKDGADKSKVARALLRGKEPKGESGLCILYEGEAAGKSICVVDTPGWDCVAIQDTTDKIKKEIVRSVTLCPPGPNAVILVLPVTTSLDEDPFVQELQTASWHMELLSSKVWNHTIVLFCCDGDVIINEHIKSAKKLLDNCDGRYYVLRNVESETQIHGLLKEIEYMVKDNCDDFFLPQIDEVMQSKTPQNITELERMYEDEETQQKQIYQKRAVPKKRTNSEGGDRPNMNEHGNH